MDQERWRRIDALFQDALVRAPEEREAFLHSACENDDDLYREVCSLVNSQQQAAGFLETPAMELAARDVAAKQRLASPMGPDAGGQLSPGAVIAGRYTVIELAGRGGMGEVYRALDNKLDQIVALKLLTAALRDNPVALIALLTEVRLARQVSHPNVCRVHDIGEADGLHFLTMEFIEGEDLGTVLRRIGRFPRDKG